MEQKQYKRQNRSVSPETAEKISKSLKSFNASHPRGTAAGGSEWSKAIQKGTKNYWKQIPPKKTEDADIEDIML